MDPTTAACRFAILVQDWGKYLGDVLGGAKNPGSRQS